MTLPHFEYLSPTTVEEASQMLSEKAPGARVMAGGTDLLVKMRLGHIKPTAVIGLKGIKNLDRINFDKREGLTLGATALLADVASHPDILKHYPAIAYAAQSTATVQVRNMATVVANLCNAAPSADNAPTLMAMGAEAHVFSGRGRRRIPLDRFFKGPGQTALEPDELVTSLVVPLPPPHSGTSYQHISPRGKVDISAVAVGVMVLLEGRVCKDAKIVLGAVAPCPMRAKKAEALVRGEKITPALAAEAGIQASKGARPITDMRASADYRRRMVEVLTKRAIEAAHKRAARP